jgi:ATP-binding cassette subfamily F protein 3
MALKIYMLKVKDLTKYYEEERILNRVSFHVAKEHKIALVGFNGVGKTTLLKILEGEESADKGKIEFGKNTRIGFLPQDPHMYNKLIAIDYLNDYVGRDDEEFRRELEIMFAGFALDPEIKNKKIAHLSSGQKTKIFLIAILLKKPNLLLLDEPTNNLDLPALIWLEDYLQKMKTAFLVVSHDKKFLDNVANKVYEIDWNTKKIIISNGKYSDYLDRKEKEHKRQNVQHEIQKADIKRLRTLAKTKKEKAAKGAKYVSPDNDRMLQGYRRNKSADSLHDAKIIYNRIDRIDEIEKPVSRKDFEIDIATSESASSKDVLVRDLICGYETGNTEKDSKNSDGGGNFKIGPVNLEIKFGSRICILGLNGSGKTTLLKTITGRIEPLSGKVLNGAGVKFGNLMQEHETLQKGETLMKFMERKVEVKKEDGEIETDIKNKKEYITNHLVHFGFRENQLNTKIGVLSPGGRARLLLAYFSATDVNVLILDEPTNHLDMEAGEALNIALDKFKGTVITVTHDRFFVERNMFETLYLLDNKKLNKLDSFKDYVAQMQKRAKKLLHLLK